jgi:serine/threonine protein kinase
MRRFQYSDFFVKFFGWYDSPGYLYIAMEYCEHGDLKKYLADNNHVLPESQVQEIIAQVLAGLAMMHEAGFANRDVKPAVSRRPDAPFAAHC